MSPNAIKQAVAAELARFPNHRETDVDATIEEMRAIISAPPYSWSDPDAWMERISAADARGEYGAQVHWGLVCIMAANRVAQCVEHTGHLS